MAAKARESGSIDKLDRAASGPRNPTPVTMRDAHRDRTAGLEPLHFGIRSAGVGYRLRFPLGTMSGTTNFN
jgi:hypothetical protein